MKHPWVVASTGSFPAQTGPSGTIRRLTPPDTMKGVEIILEERLPRGEVSPADSEMILLTLSGRPTVIVDGDAVVLDQHDFLYIGKGIGYRWSTESGEPWHVVLFC